MFEQNLPPALIEELARPRPFQEYPKMLYHPDGRNITVETRDGEDALGDSWLLNPGEAAELKAVRDANAKKALEKTVADAAAESAAKFDAAVAAAVAERMEAKAAQDAKDAEAAAGSKGKGK